MAYRVIDLFNYSYPEPVQEYDSNQYVGIQFRQDEFGIVPEQNLSQQDSNTLKDQPEQKQKNGFQDGSDPTKNAQEYDMSNHSDEYEPEIQNVEIFSQKDLFVVCLEKRFDGQLYILALRSQLDELNEKYVVKAQLQLDQQWENKDKNQYANLGDQFFRDAEQNNSSIYQYIIYDYDVPYKNKKINKWLDKVETTKILINIDKIQVNRGKKFLEEMILKFPESLIEFIEQRAYQKLLNSKLLGRATKSSKGVRANKEKCAQYLPLFYNIVTQNIVTQNIVTQNIVTQNIVTQKKVKLE